MKTTRILGFVAGVISVIALIAIGIGMIAGVTKLGIESLVFGVGAMVIALLTGIAHLLLRIKFRRPYYSRRRPKPFLVAGRVMMWVWAVAMIAMVAMIVYLAIQLGPVLFSLIAG